MKRKRVIKLMMGSGVSRNVARKICGLLVQAQRSEERRNVILRTGGSGEALFAVTEKIAAAYEEADHWLALAELQRMRKKMHGAGCSVGE